MDLRELRVERLPGLDQPFSVTAAPGLNLILGPNGSGKSSLCRAAMGLLWPGKHPGGLVSATWQEDSATWTAQRSGGDHVAWQRNGQDHPGPQIPAISQVAAFHLGVLDLLKPTTGADDRALASAVRRQLAGGYDLTPEEIPSRPGQRERKALEAATVEVDRCRADQAELARQEAGLDHLRARRTAAQQAHQQVRALKLASDLIQAREQGDSLRRQLEAGFPASMNRLHADDLAVLGALRARDLELQQEMAISGRQLSEARALQQAQGFDDGPPPAEVVARARQIHARAERLQQTRLDLRAELAGAEERMAVAARDLEPWGLPVVGEPLDAGALRAETAAAQNLLTHTARREGLEQLQDQVTLVPDTEHLPDPQAVDEARLAALDWLASAGERRWPWLATVAGCGLVAVGVLARPWLHDLPDTWVAWGALGLGAAVLAAVAMLGLARRRTRRALARHAATGLSAPAAWSESDVRRHLDWLSARRRELQDSDLRRQLTDELDRLAHAAAADLDALAAELPTGDPVAGLDRAEQLHRAAAYHLAMHDRDELKGRLEQRLHDLDEALAEAADILAPWRRDDPAAPADPEALGAALEDIAARAERHAEGGRRAETAARNLDDQGQRSDGERAAAAELLARHGLAPDQDDAFRKLIERLPAYEKLASEAHQLDTTVQVKEEELAELPADLRTLADEALGRPAAEVTEQLSEAIDLASSLDELQAEIVRIESRLETASRRSDLNQALGREATARDELVEVRSRIREATLRHLLLEGLAEQHRRMAEPPVVARTRELLLGFTHGAYEFIMPEDDAQVFRARDTRTGQGLALSALSDGTRAQLLLAARLAHVGEAERGLVLPLFLDESLTASDPARFRAVATAVLELVAAGRQVFYLTCDPADVIAWQDLLQANDRAEAPVIDLAAVRRLPAAAAPERLRPAAEVPPAPRSDEPAADYAARIQVPALSVHRPASAAHVFHLLPDRLDLLHGLLYRGLTHVGQLASLGDLLVGDGWLDTDQLASLQARDRALALFMDGFGVGRGRPVPTGELEHRSGIKSNKLAEADALLAELDGDARAFVRALDDRRIKNLKQSKSDELVDYLQDEGFLDPRPRLVREEVLAQVMQGLHDDIGQGRLGMPLLRELVMMWWNAAGGDGEQG